MQPLVGNFGEPLPRLTVHIMHIDEVPQRPETLARIPDGALHFSFFPTRRYIAGFRIKAIFAGEGQKAREETDQAAIVFGDSGRQIGIGNFAGHATECRERMHVTTEEGCENFGCG